MGMCCLANGLGGIHHILLQLVGYFRYPRLPLHKVFAMTTNGQWGKAKPSDGSDANLTTRPSALVVRVSADIELRE